MRSSMVAGAVAAAFFAAPAQAVLLGIDGVQYELVETVTANPLVHDFALVITRQNTAFDTRAGDRTGINAIAFNKTGNFVSAVMTDPVGFQFMLGGLNANGCSGSGNFFCFDNTSIGPVPFAALPTTPLIFRFSVTTSAASGFTDYAPDFKIDWVGRLDNGTEVNNYSNVSEIIDPVSICTTCTPEQQQADVPLPATAALFGIGLLGVGWSRRR